MQNSTAIPDGLDPGAYVLQDDDWVPLSAVSLFFVRADGAALKVEGVGTSGADFCLSSLALLPSHGGSFDVERREASTHVFLSARPVAGNSIEARLETGPEQQAPSVTGTRQRLTVSSSGRQRSVIGSEFMWHTGSRVLRMSCADTDADLRIWVAWADDGERPDMRLHPGAANVVYIRLVLPART